MELQTLTYIVVGASFALYIGIALWTRATTTGEFYAAGRGVHPVANGMATAADCSQLPPASYQWPVRRSWDVLVSMSKAKMLNCQ